MGNKRFPDLSSNLSLCLRLLGGRVGVTVTSVHVIRYTVLQSVSMDSGDSFGLK